MKRYIAVCLLINSLLLCRLSPAEEKERVFRAGAATSNITPPLGALIVGGWTPLPADEVHDELHVRCLVLDDGQTQLVIGLCDNVGIPREVFDAARKRVSEKLDIPPENQLYAATHTHSASSARSENPTVLAEQLDNYQEFLADRIVDAVRIAHKRLEPAQVGWGSVEEPSELFNRRWFVAEEDQRRNPFGGVDQVRMNPGKSTLLRPAGPVDPELSFLAVKSMDGRPLAVVANYSLHYVGGVPSGVISADYFAVFARRLADELQVQPQYPPFVGILSNGTSGDVNNINFRDRGPSLPPFEKMEQVGRLVARRVAEAMPGIQYHSWVSLDARRTELTLSVRHPTAEMLQYFEQVKARPAGQPAYHQHELTYAERVAQLANSPDTVVVPLQALRIGELAIAAIPFEVFTEIGLEIKKNCPLADCFTIELAGGSYGYLPTPEQHALGGYETWMGTNRVQLDASEMITGQMLEMMNELHKQSK